MGKKGRQMTELILQTREGGHKSEEKNSDETGLKERQRRLKKDHRSQDQQKENEERKKMKKT